MSNQYVNKVQYGNQVLIDLTSDTVAADYVLKDQTFHDASGATLTGTIERQAGFNVVPSRSPKTYNVSNKYMNGDITIQPIPSIYYTLQQAFDIIIPIGTVLTTLTDTNPATQLGFGTWEKSTQTMTNTWNDVKTTTWQNLKVGSVFQWTRIN